MSWQACAWAIDQQEIKDPAARHVLLCMANYANADGRASFPSVLRLARDTGMSERGVRYQLRKLEAAILIKRGNPKAVAAHIKRPDRRPLCYDLLLRGAPYAPRELTGGKELPNGGQIATERGAPLAPDPPLSSIKPPLKQEEKDRFKAWLKQQSLEPLPSSRRPRRD